MIKNRDEMIQQLRQSQQRFAEAIRPFAQKQDWRLAPQEWSFREVAAHMVTTEEECFQERIKRIASGTNPKFEYYLNSNRDFSQLDLIASLEKWRTVREASVAYLLDLAPSAWELTGHHQTFGTIRLQDVIQIMLDHDAGHLEELQPMITACT